MPVSMATAEEFRRAVLLRADELEETARHLRGRVAPGRKSLRSALQLVESLPKALRPVIEGEWERNTDATSRAQILIPFLRQLTFVADFVEKHLAHGMRRGLSEALADEIRSELSALGLSQYEVILAHGGADNFITTHGNLPRAIYRSLPPPLTAFEFYALFNIPRTEGPGAYWRPVLIGHEVAHIAVSERNAVAAFDLRPKFDFVRASTLSSPLAPAGATALDKSRALYRIAESWATELLCDAHALYRFGPAAVAALAEYFIAIGAMDQLTPTHPPGQLRIRMLLDQLGEPPERLKRVVKPWADYVPATLALPDQWAQYLAELFTGHRAEVWGQVCGFPTTEYPYTIRADVAASVAHCLREGIPGREVIELPTGEYIASTDADVVNGAWLARVDGATTPVDSLAGKAIEALEFVRRWVKNGGVLPASLFGGAMTAAIDPTRSVAGPRRSSSTPGRTTRALHKLGRVFRKPAAIAGILSQVDLEQRLNRQDASRLVVQPLLHEPKGAALDLRLANKFIAFRRTGTASLDPLDEQGDPRSIQVHVELSWSEQFVLHPQEMILGATLEYLVLPQDLTAQVVTRSSYGRLGLLSATAVQVHPNFHGCLTLELVNLSTIPLVLTPGERVAQLVLSRTTPIADDEPKYAWSVGPQFSKVRDDPEADVLRALRLP